MNAVRGHLALWSVVPAALSLIVLSCAEMIEREDLVTVKSVSPSSHACGECHVAIYEEWAASAHAEAFTDAAFQRATLGGRTESCLGCHVPESVLHRDGEPVARASLREEGVACISCHLDPESEAMVGPLTDMGPVVPHAVIEGDAWFQSSALCGSCHTAAMEQVERWAEAVEESRTCQECHMPGLERRTTQATDLISAGIVALHDRHRTRSHTFHIGAIADFPNAVEFNAERRGDEIVLMTQNRLPHAIPTGEFGQRPVMLSVDLLDSAGTPIVHREETFTRHGEEALLPLVAHETRIDAGPSAAALQATLRRMEETPVRLAGASFTLQGDDVTPLPREEIP